MTTVAQIVQEKGSAVHTVAPETELPDALRLLSRHDVGALVVVRGDAVAGVFSERYIQGA